MQSELEPRPNVHSETIVVTSRTTGLDTCGGEPVARRTKNALKAVIKPHVQLFRQVINTRVTNNSLANAPRQFRLQLAPSIPYRDVTLSSDT